MLGEQIHQWRELKMCIKGVRTWDSTVFSRCCPQLAASELPGNSEMLIPVPSSSKESAALAGEAQKAVMFVQI